jgi:hypothetical protein
MQVGAWSLTRQILHYRRQLACGAARFRDIRQGHGKHLESRGELGIVRYLILFVFVQFLLLSKIACARDVGSWPMPKMPDLFTSIDGHPPCSVPILRYEALGHSTTTTSENFVLFALEWVHTVLAPEEDVRIARV